MIKPLIALVNLIGLFLFETFFIADIKVTQDTPAMMNAGSEVRVTVTIDKGELSGFAKLQLDVPEGFTVASIETKGASFTFADQKAKFIWMALPTQPSFKVSYTLTAGGNVFGEQLINGKFSYIEDNERRTYDLATASIQVSGGTTAQQTEAIVADPQTQTEELPASTQSTEAMNDVVSASGAAPVESVIPAAVPRTNLLIAPVQGAGNVGGQRTVTLVTENELLVEVLVDKGDIRGFGKLQESIPAGFTAIEKNSDEAIFTAQGTVVKFVWLNLPAKKQLKVVYKLRSNGQPEGTYTVNGDFGYLLNDETQRAVLGSTEFAIGGAALAAQQQTATQQQTAQQPTELKPEPVVTQQPVKPAPASTETAQQPAKPKPAGRIPAPETGITYKVQITAAHREVGTAYFAGRHRYSGDFVIDRHEGWIKYVTGRFAQYRDARDQRQTYISAGHNFPGPFVTAYNNGERITVQEALMISNQTWAQ